MPTKKPNTTEQAETIADLTDRLETLEAKLRFIEMHTALGRELRMLEMDMNIRSQDAVREVTQQQQRKQATVARAKLFVVFGRQRLAMHKDLVVSQRELIAAFNHWAHESGEPRLHRFETTGELSEVMAGVYPDIETTEVESPGYMGEHPPLVPAFAGVGLVPEGMSPTQYVRQLTHEAAAEESERRLRAEERQHAASVQDAITNSRRMRDEAAALMVQAAER